MDVNELINERLKESFMDSSESKEYNRGYNNGSYDELRFIQDSLSNVEYNRKAENAINNHYLYDLKEEIAYLRAQGPGKAKSLDMLECMIDKMLPNEWEPTCFKKEKVKVKKFVVEWLIHCENRGYSLYGAMTTTNEMSGEMELWLVESSNQLMFAKAYEYGYEVEEETWEVRLRFNDKEAAEAYAHLECGKVVKIETD